jgi:hypothetical protein
LEENQYHNEQSLRKHLEREIGREFIGRENTPEVRQEMLAKISERLEAILGGDDVADAPPEA